MIARYASSKIEAVVHIVTDAGVCWTPNEVGPKIVRLSGPVNDRECPRIDVHGSRWMRESARTGRESARTACGAGAN